MTTVQNLPNLLHRRSRNDASRELIPVLHNSHLKGRPSPPAVALILECPLRPRRVGGRKKQVRIHNKQTREYIECGNQVSPKSSSLQGMKAQSLQSLFAGNLTNASYQTGCLSSSWLTIFEVWFTVQKTRKAWTAVSALLVIRQCVQIRI